MKCKFREPYKGNSTAVICRDQGKNSPTTSFILNSVIFVMTRWLPRALLMRSKEEMTVMDTGQPRFLNIIVRPSTLFAENLGYLPRDIFVSGTGKKGT